jgi:hypothetical protein
MPRHKAEIPVGTKVGMLNILKREPNNSYGQAIVKCRCECGNVKDIPYHNIKAGKVKSCGCLRAHVRSLTSKLARQKTPPRWRDIQHGGVFEYEGNLYQVTRLDL